MRLIESGISFSEYKEKSAIHLPFGKAQYQSLQYLQIKPSIENILNSPNMVNIVPKKRKRKSAAKKWTKTKCPVAPVMTPQQQEINRILHTHSDDGNRELAWRTLNMHSAVKPVCPTVNGFLATVNAMIADLHAAEIDLTQ